MNILVIQNGSLAPVGVLGDYLVQSGAQLSIWRPEHDVAPPAHDYAGLIILGGSMNAHNDDQFPHLRQVVDLIRQFHGQSKPIMGICLGAQLIARAFGSHVYPHRQPELGFSPLTVVDPNAPEAWLQGITDLHCMQWHFDTFDLPAQATLLMTNDLCRHQAYRIGSNIYGFQFHFEVTPAIVMNWLTDKEDWVAAHYPQLDAQVKEQLQAYIEPATQFAQQVANAWLELISAPVHQDWGIAN